MKRRKWSTIISKSHLPKSKLGACCTARGFATGRNGEGLIYGTLTFEAKYPSITRWVKELGPLRLATIRELPASSGRSIKADGMQRKRRYKSLDNAFVLTNGLDNLGVVDGCSYQTTELRLDRKLFIR